MTGLKQRIFLTGYMGAGKTTLGRELAAQTNSSFVDLDQFIEKRCDRTIRQIFLEKGEDGFREMERNSLHEVTTFEQVVIATGGGTPCFYDNMAFINSAGTTVYLKVPVDELARRTEVYSHTRPVLQNRSGAELRQFIAASLAKRSRFYEQAGFVIDAGLMAVDEDVERLARQLRSLLSLSRR